MKYKYCILTEKRAKEIDKLDVVDNLGRKIYVNEVESITSEDESVVFRPIWISHYEDEPDVYYLIIGDSHYFVNVFCDIESKDIQNSKQYYYTYNVKNIKIKKKGKDLLDSKKLIEILQEVFFEWNKYNRGRAKAEDTFFVDVLPIGSL